MADFPKLKSAILGAWTLLITNSVTKFALHSIRNVGIFLFIAVAALAVHQIVEYLEVKHAPSFITHVLTVAEYGALIIDVIWFLGDLAIRTYKLLRAELLA